MDVVVGNFEAPGAVFFNAGQGQFAETAWGGLDGDGWPDIAAAPSEPPNAIWFNGPVVKKSGRLLFDWHRLAGRMLNAGDRI